jgi:hypothetical protein
MELRNEKDDLMLPTSPHPPRKVYLPSPFRPFLVGISLGPVYFSSKDLNFY